MKILIVSGDDPFENIQIGGKHIHIANFYNALKNAGINCEVITPLIKLNSKNPIVVIACAWLILKDIFTGHCIRWKDRYILGVKYVEEQLVRQIRCSIRMYKDDEIFVIAEDIPSISAAFRAGIDPKRIFAVLHSYPTYEGMDYNQLKSELAIQELLNKEREAYRKCSKIVAVDNAIKDYLINIMGIPKEIIKVIFNAIDYALLNVSREEKKLFKVHLLRNMGIAKTIEHVILVPRRLVNKNGVIYAVKAMAEVRKNWPDLYEKTVMLVCGDGPERYIIEKYVKENKLRNVLLLGAIDHNKMIEIFKAADITIIPSIYTGNFAEATSLAALEGMAARCFTIVTNVGGLKEIVQDGETGAIVHEKSEQEIAEKIAYALNKKFVDKIFKITDAANEKVRREHDYFNHAKKILSFFIGDTFFNNL